MYKIMTFWVLLYQLWHFAVRTNIVWILLNSDLIHDIFNL